MSYSFFQKINVVREKSMTRIIQLERSDVKVMGKFKDVLIGLDSYPIVHQVIYIIVVYILESNGLLLSRDWSTKLQGYFSTNWTHLWLPYKGRTNQLELTVKLI
jgi:hypothetical protein